MQNLELYIQRAKYLEACEDKAFLKKEKEIDELSYEVDRLKAREKITPKNSGYEELLDKVYDLLIWKHSTRQLVNRLNLGLRGEETR
jgi:hypothetical protein